MIYNDDLLIVIDAGHGGWDNGASWNGRLEKDDNLRLALEVQRQLEAQGVSVLMTRDTDVYVSLPDRVSMANEADADLFVSLHRNSYIEQTAWTNGVENFIYLTAPMESTGMAAQYVIDAVVDVGVQSNRGVQRGNYYVLRRTIMPSMLLEMGYIINEIDNQLFDEHLVEYAAAIARGVMRYFELGFQEIPGVTPTPVPPICPPCPGPQPPVCPPCPQPELPLPICRPSPGGNCPCAQNPSSVVMETQRLVNERFGLGMLITGLYNEETARWMIMALQTALNSDFETSLAIDGLLGPETLYAFPNIFFGQRGNVVFVIQALLSLNRYSPGALDGIFGPMTRTALETFQRDHFLVPDGVVGDSTLKALLGCQ